MAGVFFAVLCADAGKVAANAAPAAFDADHDPAWRLCYWGGLCGGAWGEMTSAMNADMGRLAQFVADIPLVKLNPSPLQITSSDAQVRGWGVAGNDGGLFWVQDFSMEGHSMDDILKDKTVRKGVQLQIQGLAAGTYLLHPYNTWQGKYLTAFQVKCDGSAACQVDLPAFHADMAFRLERK